MELRACTGAEVRPETPPIPDPSATDRTTPSKHGPHPREYIVAKQQVLRACIRERRQMACAAGETAFQYRPPAEQDKGRLAAGAELATSATPPPIIGW